MMTGKHNPYQIGMAIVMVIAVFGAAGYFAWWLALELSNNATIATIVAIPFIVLIVLGVLAVLSVRWEQHHNRER